ncbi:MAG: glycosyltransferase family 39 protein [Solirubrobacterales bacterium]
MGLAVAVGIWARISAYGMSVVADEMSTLWIVWERGLGGTVSYVSGDGEISPPLYFILAWLATKLGSAPELIRLPSIVFGLASLPLYYLLGKRLFSRQAGILATTIAALSPMLVYLAGYGRSYSVMFFFLALSTLALLYAMEGGRNRWWVVYAVASAGVMYSHYTGAFVLIVQLVWLLAYSKADRVKAVLANAGAALLFLPWIPGYLADASSPTTTILEALQGYGFEAKRLAVEQVLFWKVSVDPWTSNRPDAWLITLGSLLALVAAGWMVQRRTGLIAWLRNLDRNVVLVVALILATPVGALLFATFSTDVFGTRNLAVSWIGIPLALGALLTAAGRIWGTIATLLVVAGLSIGSVAVADPSRSGVPFEEAASYIEAESEPGDIILNRAHLTPVPLTPLDAYLDPDLATNELQIGLPVSDPPWGTGDTITPDPAAMFDRAFTDGRRVILVSLDNQEPISGPDGEGLPAGFTRESEETFPGTYSVVVSIYERKGSGS